MITNHHHAGYTVFLMSFVIVVLWMWRCWGKFKFTDESLNESPIRLRHLWHKLQLPQKLPAIPDIGPIMVFAQHALSYELQEKYLKS